MAPEDIQSHCVSVALVKKRLFDPIRGREVADLPEERVRRSLVDWLVRVAGVPPRLVAVEYSLSALDPNRRDRADVVVWRPSEVAAAGGLRPWLLAECKAPGVSLGDATGDQVRRYAGEIRADHVLLTNGEETRCFGLDESGTRYLERRGLPSFPTPPPA